MIKALKEQYKTTKDDIQKLGVQIQKRNEILIKLEGALEALEALEPDEPEAVKAPTDHTEAAMALGVFK